MSSSPQEPRGSDSSASAESLRWLRVRELSEAVLASPVDARTELLDRLCAEDAELRAEVQAQVRACEQAEGDAQFLSDPAAVFAAPLLGELDPSAEWEADRPPVESTAEWEGSLREALGARYALERAIGHGGTSVVYAARDLTHGRRVALKVLKPALGASVSVERFLREIRVTAGLTHPHILPLHDSGESQGHLYYVMPYVGGETLRAHLARVGPLPVDQVIRLLREVAGALAYAHRQGVIHRDIKPANILLVDGHAVVADFGIARALHQARDTGTAGDSAATLAGESRAITAVGTSPGTPAYMAPEQARGGPGVDHRADLYALGVVGYECLAGVNPFGARNTHALLAALRGDRPTPLPDRRPDTPPTLAALLHQMLMKDPGRRPQSADDVLRALEAIAGTGMPGGHAPPTTGRGLRRGRARKIAAGLGLALLAAGGYALWPRLTTRQGPAPSEPASGNVFSVQDQLARAIFAEWTPALLGDRADSAATRLRGTPDIQAYDLFLQGRSNFMLRGGQHLVLAVRNFQDAIARDPGFARAHAGLALAYALLPVYTSTSVETAAALAEATGRKALALDSTLADSHLAVAAALDLQTRFAEALAHYKHAVQLDPGSAVSHHWYGMELLMLGRSDEALAELQRATQQDPLAVSPATAVSSAYLAARRYPEAILAGRRALALDTTNVVAIMNLGQVLAFAGHPDSAVRLLEHGLRVHPDDSRLQAELVFAYAALGRWADARALRSRLHAQEAPGATGADAALADLVFGDPAPLARTLSTTQGVGRFVSAGGILGCNPYLDPLWSRADFRAFMQRLAIAPCRQARPWPLPPVPAEAS